MDKYQTVNFLEKVKDGVEQKANNVKTEHFETNYIILLDKSASMKYGSKKGMSRWDQSSSVVSNLAQACCASSPSGISLYFFGNPGKLDMFTGIKSHSQVVDLFTKTKPSGSTCLEGALAAAFKSHFTRDAQTRTKCPTSILVITDGEPNSKSAVVDEIALASKRCTTKTELSVSFMQVGDDSQCMVFFGKLNKPKNRSKFNNCPVDCLTYSQISNIDDFVSQSLK